jgi:hypothetical protein
LKSSEFITTGIAFTNRSVAALQEKDPENRRPPMPSLIITLGGAIAAVCSRCQSQRNYEFAMDSPDSRRDTALQALWPYLRGGTGAEAIAACMNAANAGGTKLSSARIFAFIASILPEHERTEILRRALTLARRPAILAEAVNAARAIPVSCPTEERAAVFTALAGQVPEAERANLVAEAIAAVHRMEDEYDKRKVLMKLAPYLSPDVGPQAIAATRTIKATMFRANVLEKLESRVREQDLVPALTECLDDARAIGDVHARRAALSALGKFLTDEVELALLTLRAPLRE